MVSVCVLLGVLGMLWRIWRPAPEDSEARRLGSMLVLATLLGYSLVHGLGMTLFRGQNYLPVVPFSSLAAAWALVEAWRLLARLPFLRVLARPAVAAVLWLGVCAALLAQETSIVYERVVPTNFAVANASLLAGLDSLGLRQVIYERGMGTFQSGGRARRPRVGRGVGGWAGGPPHGGPPRAAVRGCTCAGPRPRPPRAAARAPSRRPP